MSNHPQGDAVPVRHFPEERFVVPGTSAADENALGAARADRQRGERAMATLDASLRAAGIEGFSTGYDWEARRVVVRFDSPTDAYLAATRLVYLRTGPAPAGEGEPEHYEAIDRPTATVQEAEAVRRTPTIRDWAQAHQSFRAMRGHGADPNSEGDLAELRRLLPAAVRPPLREETGRRTGW